MIGAGTLVNVAAGSGLKIISYVAGRIIDGYFESRKQTTEALAAKAGVIVQLQSGSDTADDHTKHTRRVLAFMFCFTACFVISTFALDSDSTVPILTDKELGVFGWIFGGKSQTVVQVSKAQMIVNIWPIMEMIAGFFFTKMGK